MTCGKLKSETRRAFLHALLAAPLLLVFSKRASKRSEELVEIDGWILKRSDLA